MLEVKVVRKIREAEDVFSYELAATNGQSLPAFSAGSHIDVHLPSGLVRQYSLCNHPGDLQHYQIGVLLDPASRGGSKAMHEQVSEGDHLKISEPRSLFPLTHASNRTLLFAGGIGITPILCMAERLAQTDASFTMHYCCRSEVRTAFVERIRQSRFAGQVSFHFDDLSPEQRLQAPQILSNYAEGDHLYVCGPGGFMKFILSAAREASWPETSLHREYFAAAPQQTAGSGSFEIQLASSGRRLVIPAERTVAEVLLESGVDIPLSCEQGIYGTCVKLRLNRSRHFRPTATDC